MERIEKEKRIRIDSYIIVKIRKVLIRDASVTVNRSPVHRSIGVTTHRFIDWYGELVDRGDR